MSASAVANRVATPAKWASVLLIVLAFFLVARTLPMGRALKFLGGWIDGLGALGILVFAGVYVVATVLLLPGSALTLGGGAIFGLVEGTVAVSIGSTVGAACAFLVGRYLARDRVAELARSRPKFDAVDRAISQGGWKIVALLRLSPAIPFNLQNYLYGLTAIRFWPYVGASWLFMLPGTFMYIYFGYIGGASVQAATGAGGSTDLLQWILRIVGLLATIVVTVYVTRLATRAIREHTQMADTAGTSLPDGAREKATRKVQGWPWGATVLALVAALAVAVGAYAQLNAAAINRLFGRLFGPPAVTLSEAYEERPDGPSVDHSRLDALLHAHVDEDGWVDYAELAQEPDELDAYVAMLAEVPFDDLGRDEKLALLINAYNAFTLRLVLDHYPIESIRDIPAGDRWEAERWNVGGNIWSLNQIEHEQIRPRFVEPRIHFALVCAAVGCPKLRAEAYDAGRLEEQLEDQAVTVHQDDRWFRYDSAHNTVHLTRLYDWYGDDFAQVAGSVLEYAARYSPELHQALERGQAPEVAWLEYDWSLNDKRDPEE